LEGFVVELDEDDEVFPVLPGLLGLKMLEEDVEVFPVLLGLSDLLGFVGLVDDEEITPAPTATALVNGTPML
jgi:hypothetical protein